MPIVKKAQDVEEFKKIIEAYRVQNPVKFAQKKPFLMAKLAKLGGKPEKEEKEEKEEKKDEK